MFLKKLPKRTKLLLTIMLGLGIVACGVFIWGYSTGALKSSASIPPGATPISGKITGEVHDSATDARIAGASASAESSGPSMGPGVTSGQGPTDINGVFQIQNMASASYKVTVSMSGYNTWTGSTICAFYEISASAGGFLGRVRLIKHDNCNLGKIVLTKTGSSTSWTIRAFAKDASTSAAINEVKVTMAGTPGCTTGTDGAGKCVLKTGAASGTYTATFTKTGIYNDATVPQRCDFTATTTSCTITASMTKSGGGTTGTGTLKGEVTMKKPDGTYQKICQPTSSRCLWEVTFNSSPDLGTTPVNTSSWYSISAKAGTYTITGADLRNTSTGVTKYWRPSSSIQKSITSGGTIYLNLPFQ